MGMGKKVDARHMTNLARFLFLSIAVAFIHSCTTATSMPPKQYVDQGACPFECCTYRQWTVEQRTVLRATPKDGTKLVGILEKGETVTGLTGIVETLQPGKVEVVRAHTSDTSGKSYKPGDVLWVYTYLGEGFFKVWFQGEMIEEDIGFVLHGVGGWIRCVDDGTCWGRGKDFPKSIWWVKVKPQKSLEGWSNEPGNFGNKDACG
jgi:hypothetical protein